MDWKVLLGLSRGKYTRGQMMRHRLVGLVTGFCVGGLLFLWTWLI